MSTFYLLSGDDVVEALGQNPDLMSDSAGSIDSAINRAQIKLEVELQTSFDASSIVDIFHADPKEDGYLSGWYRFRLSSGCLRSAAVVVETSETYDGTYTVTTLPVSVITASGLVKVYGNLEGLFVRMSYEAGFMTGDIVPNELKQAVLCYTPLYLLSASSATVDPKQATATAAKASSMEEMAQTMYHRYNRRIGASFKPIHSTITLL